jgi:RND family efflux transporter MFP subunit
LDKREKEQSKTLYKVCIQKYKAKVKRGLNNMKYKTIVPLIFLSFFIVGCGSDVEEEVQVRRVPVEVTSAYESSISNETSFSGTIIPSDSVSVFTEVPGRVVNTHFEVGDYVNAGQTMVNLDQGTVLDQIRVLESQVRIAEQSIAMAQNTAMSITGGQFENQIQQLEGGVTAAQTQISSAELAMQNADLTATNAEFAKENANLALTNATNAKENVQTNFDNTTILFNAGLVSRNDFESMQLALTQAQASVEQAQIAYGQATVAHSQATIAQNQTKVSHNQALESLENAQGTLNITGQTVAQENVTQANLALNQAKASRDAAQVQLDIARSSLDNMSIQAPMSGVVATSSVREGEFASPQIPVYTIINTQQVKVRVNVSQTIVNNLYMGKEVYVYVDAVSNQPFVGTIVEISPGADQSATFPVEIQLENPDALLRPGMFAEVTFNREAAQNSIVVPRNTVLRDNQGEFVYINKDSVAVRVDVTTGIDNGMYIEILSGVSVGDEIVTTGQTFVTNGEEINVTNRSQSSNTGSIDNAETEEIYGGN